MQAWKQAVKGRDGEYTVPGLAGLVVQVKNQHDHRRPRQGHGADVGAMNNLKLDSCLRLMDVDRGLFT